MRYDRVLTTRRRCLKPSIAWLTPSPIPPADEIAKSRQQPLRISGIYLYTATPTRCSNRSHSLSLSLDLVGCVDV